MEYGKTICGGEVCDDGYMRHVGWAETIKGDISYNKFFSKNTLNTISRKITELTRGVDRQNRRIIVPDKNICSVMSDVYSSYRPETGDIYSRYNIPNGKGPNSLQELIDRTIEIYVSQIKNEFEMTYHNESLNIWDATLLGDFNNKGLRQHAPIKIRNRNTSHRGEVSFMNY